MMLVQEITRNVVWNITERLKDRCADCTAPRAVHDAKHDFVEPPAPKEAT